MELATKASGKMISSMDMARRLGQMDPFIKEIINKARSMDMVGMNGTTDLNTKETGSRIKSKALEHTVG